MKFGDYNDRGLDKQTTDKYPWNEHKLNSQGYRCPEWDPMPDGKKNIVVLGCSHTFGQALDDNEHWVSHLSQHNTSRLRYWNLGVPGASGDSCVRLLWGTQNLIDPRIVIMCWPDESRRELSDPAHNTVEHDTDNFLKNVFVAEKFGEITQSKVFHCFAQNTVAHPDLKNINVLEEYTLANCWPYWDKFTARALHPEPDLARDGVHYGAKHHERFAQLFLEKFSVKLK